MVGGPRAARLCGIYNELGLWWLTPTGQAGVVCLLTLWMKFCLVSCITGVLLWLSFGLTFLGYLVWALLRLFCLASFFLGGDSYLVRGLFFFVCCVSLFIIGVFLSFLTWIEICFNSYMNLCLLSRSLSLLGRSLSLLGRSPNLLGRSLSLPSRSFSLLGRSLSLPSRSLSLLGRSLGLRYAYLIMWYEVSFLGSLSSSTLLPAQRFFSTRYLVNSLTCYLA